LKKKGTFSDATNPNQMVMFRKEPPVELRRLLAKQFSGTEAAFREINEWVVADTPYREAHVKGALKALELSNPPELEPVNAGPTRKRGTYPEPSVRLRFRAVAKV
jgi:hypothetical protein